MRQLVELHKRAADFEKMDAELIFVFREEAKGVDGLKAIHARVETKFTLAVDLDKKSSKAYSPKQGEYDNYVIDKSGIVVGRIDGTKAVRATADKLLELLDKAQKSKPSDGKTPVKQ